MRTLIDLKNSISHSIKALAKRSIGVAPFFQTFVPLGKYDNTPLQQFFAPGAGTNALSSITDAGFINALFQIAIIVGSTLATVQIARAGIAIVNSRDNASKRDEGKKMLTSAITGLVLLLGTFLILNQINPDITSLKGLTLNSLTSPTVAAPAIPTLGTPAPNPTGQNAPNVQPNGQYCDALGNCY
jgi:Type IV secretion system pilin